jgi:hypothetical protein
MDATIEKTGPRSRFGKLQALARGDTGAVA